MGDFVRIPKLVFCLTFVGRRMSWKLSAVFLIHRWFGHDTEKNGIETKRHPNFVRQIEWKYIRKTVSDPFQKFPMQEKIADFIQFRF